MVGNHQQDSRRQTDNTMRLAGFNYNHNINSISTYKMANTKYHRLFYNYDVSKGKKDNKFKYKY